MNATTFESEVHEKITVVEQKYTKVHWFNYRTQEWCYMTVEDWKNTDERFKQYWVGEFWFSN